MEGEAGYFDFWLESQEKIIKNLRKISEQKHSEEFFRHENDDNQDFESRNSRHVWFEQILEDAKKSSIENHKAISETLAKTLNGASIYSVLYNHWKPFINAAHANDKDDEGSVKFANLMEYKKILDRIFGFPLAQVDDSFDQLIRWVESFFPGHEAFTSRNSTEEQYSNLFSKFSSSCNSKDLEFHQYLIKLYTETFGKIFPLISVDFTREKTEGALKGLEYLTTYLLTIVRYQHIVYVTGQAAIEKTVSIVLEEINRGEESGSFDEFFDLWVDTNETMFQDLFGTDEFSDTQNQMMRSYIELRKHMEDQVELYLVDYPIPVRSEMNDLYRTIYELKKKVKNLEKNLGKVEK